ncbi:hypothetical protein [Desulfurobacterium atlanticum]|uniref:Outer membrane protein beta-barrel domain-containing protein n=1 Tax=Desulfurobacterium atlanticum TaxID=240169 RepID=A0A238Y0V4_9BACT|nr:hypothetical protein [Desulfurobacterium atlanticum]SNR64401.1 hypothetical protein SAMN06265340_1023 [Desulfurobacterium atlanticum]
MKKKVICLTVSLLLFSHLSYGAEQPAENSAKREPSKISFKLPGNQWRIGVDTIFAGKMKRSSEGAPKYLYGISAGGGIAFRYYITTKNELQTVHPYAEAGTTSLIYPYIGGGIEYGLPVEDDISGQKSAFSIGGGVYLFSKLYGAKTLFFPIISVSYSFK